MTRSPNGAGSGHALLRGDRLACRRGERLVFADLSFELGAGEALVLTGANGSGKSSLLRLLATLIAPAAGRLAWGDTSVWAEVADFRARLHYVGHLTAIKLALTPREMLAFWTALRGGGSADDAAIEDALAAFALESVADWPCRWLSAGQRHRLALARLLATPASIWLLDEPTSGLDADSQTRLERQIAIHRAGGGRVVLTTHLPLAVPDAKALMLDRFAPHWDADGDDGAGDEMSDPLAAGY